MKRNINDIWETIRVTIGVTATIITCGGIFISIISITLLGRLSLFIFVLGFLILIACSYGFVKDVWSTYNRGIEFDFTDESLTFPASDVENGLADILTFKAFLALPDFAG